MQAKRVLIPERLRKVPPREFGFGWIDRRFLHEGYVSRCDPPALALYLLLTVVADAQGLSFYADATLARLLSLPAGAIGPRDSDPGRTHRLSSTDHPSSLARSAFSPADTGNEVGGHRARRPAAAMARWSASDWNALKPNDEVCHVERRFAYDDRDTDEAGRECA